MSNWGVCAEPNEGGRKEEAETIVLLRSISFEMEN